MKVNMNLYKYIKFKWKTSLAARCIMVLMYGIVVTMLIRPLFSPYSFSQLSDSMLTVAEQRFKDGELVWRERYGYNPGDGIIDPQRYHYYALQDGPFLFCYVFPEDVQQGDTILYLLFQKVLNSYYLKTITPVAQDKLSLPISDEFPERDIKVYLGPDGISLYNGDGRLRAQSTVQDHILIT